MKILLTFVLLSMLITDPGKISQINRAKEEAKKAYQAGDYATAITKYTYLNNELAVNEDELRLNLANAYFQVSDTVSAIGHYQTLTQSGKNTIRSTAQQQLGQQQDKKDQQNDQQKKDEQKEQEKKDKDKQDQEKKDQDKNSDPDKDDKKKDDQQKEEQQNKDQQEDKKENKPSSEKLEQMKITEDKAKMILDAMKNQEIQYLQQNKRKATQPKDKNKPDW
jgi:Ca-activated chloride channel homolog